MNETKLCPCCGEEIKSIAIKCKHYDLLLSGSSDFDQFGQNSPDTLIRQALADKYELLEAVGIGGMATVYKTGQKMLGRMVALKVIHQNLLHNQEFVKRFLHEGYLSSLLRLPAKRVGFF